MIHNTPFLFHTPDLKDNKNIEVIIRYDHYVFFITFKFFQSPIEHYLSLY